MKKMKKCSEFQANNDEGEWQTVRKKTRKRELQRKTKKTTKGKANFVYHIYEEKNNNCSTKDHSQIVQDLVDEIQSIILKLRRSEFFIELETILQSGLDDSPTDLVCYGLGSLVSSNSTASKNCSYQVALACLLRQQFQIPTTLVFDPVLQEADKEVLQKLNIQILDQNEGGKRIASAATLFFMPHCPMRLYSNLLWANWGDQLKSVYILGNSFEAYNDRIVDAKIREDPSNCILRLLPLMYERVCSFAEKKNTQLPFGFAAFSDLSFIRFLASTLQSRDGRQILLSRPPEFSTDFADISKEHEEFISDSSNLGDEVLSRPNIPT